MATGKFYPNLQNPKRNLRKKASVLCFVLFLSLFTQLVNSIPPTSSIERVDETMNAGSTAGFQAASPIIVEESINVTFETSQLPYRWFSTTGLTNNTYILSLYTSEAGDEQTCVNLGGRPISQKKR